MTAHRLGLLEVALRLDDEALAQPLMDRAAALRTAGLAPLIDRLCGAASPPGRVQRIDRLVLDLGTLPWDGLEDALLQRLEPLLRQALAQALRDAPAAADDAAAARDWLTLRARTGLLPWWAAAAGDAVAAHQVQVLRAARGWQALLASLAGEPPALRRLARIGGAAVVAVDDDASTAALQAAAAEIALRLAAPGATPPGTAGPDAAQAALAADTPAARRWRTSLLAAIARHGGSGVLDLLTAALRWLPEADQALLRQAQAGPAAPPRGRCSAAAAGRRGTRHADRSARRAGRG